MSGTLAYLNERAKSVGMINGRCMVSRPPCRRSEIANQISSVKVNKPFRTEFKRKIGILYCIKTLFYFILVYIYRQPAAFVVFSGTIAPCILTMDVTFPVIPVNMINMITVIHAQYIG